MRSSLRVCSFSTHGDAGCLLTPAQASLSIRGQQPGAGLTLERFPTASQENCFCSPALVTASLALIVINEIRSKSWRKLNTFLGSVARNRQSSGQKPISFLLEVSVCQASQPWCQPRAPCLTSLVSGCFLSFLRIHTAVDQVLTGKWAD